MHGVIKVADFGLTEDLCGSNYYRPRKSEAGNERMPIRWMAPESIEKGIYNEKTDVVGTWSQASRPTHIREEGLGYGWEVYTFD